MIFYKGEHVMTHMQEQELKMEREERRWQRREALYLRKYELKQKKKRIFKMYFPPFTLTKWLMIFLFANCTAIELFTAYATIQSIQLARELMISPDFTPLVALIGAVVGEVIAFAVYMLKSMKENSAGGITYEAAMLELNAKG